MTSDLRTDAQDITNVLLTERAARDLAEWTSMRESFTDDSHVRISWFQGSGPDFVDASRAMYEAGSRSFHEIGAPHIAIRDGHATAHAGIAVPRPRQPQRHRSRPTSYGRLYWRVRDVRRRWLIAGMQMLYLKDTLAPVDPTGAISRATVATAVSYRSSYRYLATLLQAAGYQIDADLPGIDRPDLVQALLDEQDAWLAAEEE